MKAMTKEEYQRRFTNFMTSLGVSDDVAECEFNAWFEEFCKGPDSMTDPEGDAEEALSYWSE